MRSALARLGSVEMEPSKELILNYRWRHRFVIMLLWSIGISGAWDSWRASAIRIGRGQRTLGDRSEIVSSERPTGRRVERKGRLPHLSRADVAEIDAEMKAV